MAVRNQVQLITYADSLGGDLKNLKAALAGPLAGLFSGGVHILPPFPSSADRGFAPKTYFEIEPAFGTWDDVAAIGKEMPVLVDFMVNHISRQSEYFQDFVRHGRSSKYADLFITVDKIWPDGKVPPQDIAKIFLRKPDHPFSDITVQDTGKVERVWTSFGTKDWSEQVDLDVKSPQTQKFLLDILKHLAQNGVKIVRLDAVGYVTKKAGTACFFNDPEIWDFMNWIKQEADALGLDLLPEVHAHVSLQRAISAHGFWTYDFVLPGLILHTLYTGQADKLAAYLKTCPKQQFTMLDCHDGIPVQPDLDDILTTDEARSVVDLCLKRGANLNRILGDKKGPGGFDAHQINITYYDALGRDDDAYIAARALQFFAPGVPQVYYVGLLAGENDQEAYRKSGEGRAVNRHDYSPMEIGQDSQKPVVKRLMDLIQLRNSHPAFAGELAVEQTSGELILTWVKGADRCRLTLGFPAGRITIDSTEKGKTRTWRP